MQSAAFSAGLIGYFAHLLQSNANAISAKTGTYKKPERLLSNLSCT